MKQFARLALAAALIVSTAAAPARADDKFDLQSKLTAALKAARSFVATTVVVANGVSTTTTYVAPDRTKTDVLLGQSTRQIITIGDVSYTSRDGAAFERGTVPTALVAQLKSLTEVSVSALAPDVAADGATYGAFKTIVGLAPQAVTLTCTYDKKTYRLAKCASSEVIQTFGNYDDPKNVVEAPKAAS
ncbi:MAG: hypothetical protein ABR591_10435 [Candidatus Velthaea sp.]